LTNEKGDLKQFIEDQKTGGARDNGRTPFQWNATANSGFTSGTPWLKVNDNHITLNAEAQEKDPKSCLNYFRKMVKLRKSNLALVYGKYVLIDAQNPNIYAYTREFEGKKLLVVLNFSSQNATLNTSLNVKNAKILINNYDGKSSVTTLRAYEAAVYQL
jgi:oligo-1,6-glucosidase